LRAHVQWRHGEELGLAFPDAGSQPNRSADAELVERVTKLEAEVAAMRRVLKQIKSGLPGGGEEAA
jgi:uncharacterized protein YceH (UPF0502 family)